MVDIEAPGSETSDWDTSNSDAVRRLRGAAFDRLQTAGYHCLQILQSFLPLLLVPLGLLLVLPILKIMIRIAPVGDVAAALIVLRVLLVPPHQEQCKDEGRAKGRRGGKARG